MRRVSLHVFWILSLGPGLLKAGVHCLLFRKNGLCLNADVCLRDKLGLLQATNSFLQGMKQQGLQSSQKCFPLAQRHFNHLPEAVLGAKALRLVWGCQELDWGKRKTVYIRFWHHWEVRWKQLIAAQHYNRELFHWKARHWCVLEANQLLCQLSDSKF